MNMNTKNGFMAGARYESPVTEVRELHTEGVLCSSIDFNTADTQDFDDEMDFEW